MTETPFASSASGGRRARARRRPHCRVPTTRTWRSPARMSRAIRGTRRGRCASSLSTSTSRAVGADRRSDPARPPPAAAPAHGWRGRTHCRTGGASRSGADLRGAGPAAGVRLRCRDGAGDRLGPGVARRVAVRDRRDDLVRRRAWRCLGIRRARCRRHRAGGCGGLEAAAGVAAAGAAGALGPPHRGGRGRSHPGRRDACRPGSAGRAGPGCPRAATTCSAGTSRSGPCSRSRSPCTRCCAQSRCGAGTWPGGGSFSGRAGSSPVPIWSGSCSARCRLGSACAARGAASPAPTRPAPSPATPSRRPPGWRTARGRCRTTPIGSSWAGWSPARCASRWRSFGP